MNNCSDSKKVSNIVQVHKLNCLTSYIFTCVCSYKIIVLVCMHVFSINAISCLFFFFGLNTIFDASSMLLHEHLICCFSLLSDISLVYIHLILLLLPPGNRKLFSSGSLLSWMALQVACIFSYSYVIIFVGIYRNNILCHTAYVTWFGSLVLGYIILIVFLCLTLIFANWCAMIVNCCLIYLIANKFNHLFVYFLVNFLFMLSIFLFWLFPFSY